MYYLLMMCKLTIILEPHAFIEGAAGPRPAVDGPLLPFYLLFEQVFFSICW